MRKRRETIVSAGVAATGYRVYCVTQSWKKRIQVGRKYKLKVKLAGIMMICGQERNL